MFSGVESIEDVDESSLVSISESVVLASVGVTLGTKIHESPENVLLVILLITT